MRQTDKGYLLAVILGFSFKLKIFIVLYPQQCMMFGYSAHIKIGRTVQVMVTLRSTEVRVPPYF